MAEIFVIFILGLVVGSFLNVVIYRLPKDKSIIFPPSSCALCSHKLSALDLIPVISYVFLKGRCRYCHKKISIRYPIVEIITGSFFVVLYLRFGITYDLLFSMFFAAILIAIAFIDLDVQIIPDSLSIAGLIAGIIYGFYLGSIMSSIAGVLLGVISMLFVYSLGTIIYKKEAMGIGDIKFGAMIGSFLGWKNLILTLYLSFLFAAFISLILIFLKKKKKEDIIPFGPFMAIAAFLVLLLGEHIWRWYLAFFLK